MDAMFKKFIYVVLFGLLAACATSPTGRRQLVLLPESQIVVMGVQSFHQLQDNTPIEKKPAVNAYVQCVADAITRLPPVQEQSTDWEVVVFDSKDVNAFALPGGKIGVYNGLLTTAQTQDQLAAVIGHEVGHVLARHGNERMSQQFAAQQGLALLDTWMTANNSGSRQTAMALLGIGAQVGVLLPFSRIQESEADKIGLHLMAMAGFDPRESVKLWQNMSNSGGGNPPEFMSTHPSHDTRIHDLEAGMASAVTRYEEARAAGRRPACKAPA
ncbi:MAG: peptidase [Gammaproteobacteria bacterium]|nr:MAG: peptidase [Gammaproteobacteria bacterium]TND01474.1 MAG: peptidase [Gammaproteobacteria bacterium]